MRAIRFDMLTKNIMKKYIWAGSSIGRALLWHSRGNGFESRPVHKQKWLTVYGRPILFYDVVNRTEKGVGETGVSPLEVCCGTNI